MIVIVIVIVIVMDKEIEEYALNFIETVLNPLNSEDLILEFTHYIVDEENDLNIDIGVIDGSLNRKEIAEKVRKYGFEVYLTLSSGINNKTGGVYKICTIYKALSDVQNAIRVKGLNELLS